MKDASKILYKVGNIINLIAIILGAILAIVCFICSAGVDTSSAADMGKTVKEAQTLFTTGGIILVVCVIIWVVVYVLAKKAIKALNDASDSVTPHVIMIVIGAIGSSIFYLLGGIFGVFAEKAE